MRNTVPNYFYTDDYLGSLSFLESASKLICRLTHLFRTSGLILAKFISKKSYFVFWKSVLLIQELVTLKNNFLLWTFRKQFCMYSKPCCWYVGWKHWSWSRNQKLSNKPISSKLCVVLVWPKTLRRFVSESKASASFEVRVVSRQY